MNDKPKKEKKLLHLTVDTPNMDVEFDRNAEGERNVNVKVEKMPFLQKVKQIGKLLFGKP